MFYVIPVLFVIVLIYTFVQMKKGATWAKPAVVILIIVGILAAWITMFLRMREPAYRTDYRVYEIIGHELTKAFSEYLPLGGRVIVFIPYPVDNTSHNPMHDYYMKGFKSGFSQKNISIGEVINLPVLEIGLPQGEYNKQLQKFYNDKFVGYKEIDGWITLGGLTTEPQKLDVFLAANSPRIALIGGMTPQISSLIEKGLIQIIISGTPEVHVVKKGQKIPPAEMFQTRYMMVTQNNLSQIIGRYPQFAPSVASQK